MEPVESKIEQVAVATNVTELQPHLWCPELQIVKTPLGRGVLEKGRTMLGELVIFIPRYARVPGYLVEHIGPQFLGSNGRVSQKFHRGVEVDGVICDFQMITMSLGEDCQQKLGLKWDIQPETDWPYGPLITACTLDKVA